MGTLKLLHLHFRRAVVTSWGPCHPCIRGMKRKNPRNLASHSEHSPPIHPPRLLTAQLLGHARVDGETAEHARSSSNDWHAQARSASAPLCSMTPTGLVEMKHDQADTAA